MSESPNLIRMNEWVEAQRGFALNHDDPQSYLKAQAGRLNVMMGQLSDARCPAHLTGLTAFDLANARDRLTATISC